MGFELDGLPVIYVRLLWDIGFRKQAVLLEAQEII